MQREVLMRKVLMFLAELFQVKILKEGSTENTKIVGKSVFRIQNAGRHLTFKLKTRVFSCGELNFRGRRCKY